MRFLFIIPENLLLFIYSKWFPGGAQVRATAVFRPLAELTGPVLRSPTRWNEVEKHDKFRLL